MVPEANKMVARLRGLDHPLFDSCMGFRKRPKQVFQSSNKRLDRDAKPISSHRCGLTNSTQDVTGSNRHQPCRTRRQGSNPRRPRHLPRPVEPVPEARRRRSTPRFWRWVMVITTRSGGRRRGCIAALLASLDGARRHRPLFSVVLEHRRFRRLEIANVGFGVRGLYRQF